MKNPRVIVTAIIAVAGFVTGAGFTAWHGAPVPVALAAVPTPESLGLPAFQPQEAKIDREQFRASATSLLRADMLACRNLDAKQASPRAITPDEFAKAMTGVWLAKQRSVHGIAVEMDTAYYIQMTAQGGQAVLIDRNNMRQGRFARALQPTIAKAKPARPLTQTFVNCRFEFLDQYVKVSDTVPVQTLLTATQTTLKRAASAAPPTLEEAWRGIVSSRYFGERSGVGTGIRLGDRKRFAVLPNGLRTSEGDIERGASPGAEYMLPMAVGGFFRATLSPTTGPAGQPAVTLNIDAEYAGTGVNLNPNEVTKGIERGTFVGEGDGFVAFGKEGYMTSDCGAKNGLVEPGMIFERYVIR
jgi:hypothetical protein